MRRQRTRTGTRPTAQRCPRKAESAHSTPRRAQATPRGGRAATREEAGRQGWRGENHCENHFLPAFPTLLLARWGQTHAPARPSGERPSRTAAAGSLLSARTRSKSLRLSGRPLLFFPLGKGSFGFLGFLFDPKRPMSHRGHST